MGHPAAQNPEIRCRITPAGPFSATRSRPCSHVCVGVCVCVGEHAARFAIQSPAEKARFYRIARRSATECAAAIDICRALGLNDEPDLETGDEILRRIVSMLTKMIMRVAPIK